MSTAHGANGGPLSGLRVLSLAEQYPGPFCTMIFAELGADVIQVERPAGGDPSRMLPGFYGALNHSKRSVALDLNRQDDLDTLFQLVAGADIFIEGFRPGRLNRFGLGSDELCVSHPELVYLSISGFGQDSDHRHRPAHDISFQGFGGVLESRLDGKTHGAPPELLLADTLSGLYAAIAILSALQGRTRTGKGGYIDLAMADTVASAMTAFIGLLDDPGAARPQDEPAYDLFQCADGQWITLSIAHEDNWWALLCRELELGEELAALERPKRVEARESLKARIAAAIALQPREYWQESSMPTARCGRPHTAFPISRPIPISRRGSSSIASARPVGQRTGSCGSLSKWLPIPSAKHGPHPRWANIRPAGSIHARERPRGLTVRATPGRYLFQEVQMIEADTGLEISSLVSSDGSVEVGLREVRLPVPGPDEVIVRIEASPVNPSDLIQMLALADLGTASLGEREGRPLLTAKVHPGMMPSVAMRVGVPQRVGTEGAGTVVRAGSRWQHIVGRTVSLLSDGCFAQYRCMRGDACFVMPEGVTAREAASASGNPLTALGIVETVRQHGGTALIHSAAASSVGRMLIRLCREEGIELVNIVRREAQAEELKQLGAAHVLASEAEGFRAGLADAIAGTGADIAFDAVGGRLTGDILGDGGSRQPQPLHLRPVRIAHQEAYLRLWRARQRPDPDRAQCRAELGRVGLAPVQLPRRARRGPRRGAARPRPKRTAHHLRHRLCRGHIARRHPPARNPRLRRRTGLRLKAPHQSDLPPSEWSKIDDILDYEGDKECRARSIARKRLSASCVKRRLCWRRVPRRRKRVGGSRSANRPIIGGAVNMAV